MISRPCCRRAARPDDCSRVPPARAGGLTRQRMGIMWRDAPFKPSLYNMLDMACIWRTIFLPLPLPLHADPPDLDGAVFPSASSLATPSSLVTQVLPSTSGPPVLPLMRRHISLPRFCRHSSQTVCCRVGSGCGYAMPGTDWQWLQARNACVTTGLQYWPCSDPAQMPSWPHCCVVKLRQHGRSGGIAGI